MLSRGEGCVARQRTAVPSEPEHHIGKHFDSGHLHTQYIESDNIVIFVVTINRL